MTVEDAAMRWAGLDPVKVHADLVEANRLLGVAQTQFDAIDVILKNVAVLVGVVDKELPATKKLIVDIRSHIAAFEAKQKQLNQPWRT